MLKSIGICVAILATACGSTVISKNTYKGDGKNYLCTTKTGEQESRKFVDISSFPDCVEIKEDISNNNTSADATPAAQPAQDHEAVSTPGAVYLPLPIENK